MDKLTKACKTISWFILISVAITLVAMVFGILGAKELQTETDNEFLKYLMIGIVSVTGIAMAISTIIAFTSLRGGDVKSALLALAKHSRVQFLAPTVGLFFGIVGCCQQAEPDGAFITALIICYIVLVFVTGLNKNGLTGYRKDKETYSYIATTSFIVCVIFIIYLIMNGIAMSRIGGTGNSHFVGYSITFIILFTLGDLVSFLLLGILTLFVKKYAPKTTMADADAKKLDDISEGIKEIKTAAVAPAAPTYDTADELRKYKALYDEGVITKEEFEKKKADLLK